MEDLRYLELADYQKGLLRPFSELALDTRQIDQRNGVSLSELALDSRQTVVLLYLLCQGGYLQLPSQPAFETGQLGQKDGVSFSQSAL